MLVILPLAITVREVLKLNSRGSGQTLPGLALAIAPSFGRLAFT